MRSVIINAQVTVTDLKKGIKDKLIEQGVPTHRLGATISMLMGELLQRPSDGIHFVSRAEIDGIIREFVSCSYPSVFNHTFRSFLKTAYKHRDMSESDRDKHYYRVLKALIRLRGLHLEHLTKYKEEYLKNGRTFTPAERASIRNIYCDPHMKAAHEEISLPL